MYRRAYNRVLEAEEGSEMITDKDEKSRMRAQTENETRKLVGEFVKVKPAKDQDIPPGQRCIGKLRNMCQNLRAPENDEERRRRNLLRVLTAETPETHRQSHPNQDRKDKGRYGLE